MKKIIILAAMALVVSCNSESGFDATGTFEATEIVVSAEGTYLVVRY